MIHRGDHLWSHLNAIKRPKYDTNNSYIKVETQMMKLSRSHHDDQYFRVNYDTPKHQDKGKDKYNSDSKVSYRVKEPSPFADMKLPGNYTSIYEMVRHKRQKLLDAASKHKLSSVQKDILATDLNYRRKKEILNQKKVEIQTERLRNKLLIQKQDSSFQFSSVICPLQLTKLPLLQLAKSPRITNNQRLNNLLLNTLTTIRQDSIHRNDVSQSKQCKHAIQIKSISPSHHSRTQLNQSPKSKLSTDQYKLIPNLELASKYVLAECRNRYPIKKLAPYEFSFKSIPRNVSHDILT